MKNLVLIPSKQGKYSNKAVLSALSNEECLNPF